MKTAWLVVVALSFVVQNAAAQTRSASPAGYLPENANGAHFMLPVGWTGNRYPDGGVVFLGPQESNGERCQITVFPMGTSSGDLLNDAAGFYRFLFKLDPFAGYPMPPTTLNYGVSPFGWQYLILKKATGGQVGDYGSLIAALVLVASAGKELSIIVGRSKDPLVSQCFGEIVRDEWSRFLYSLHFPNWEQQGQQGNVVNQLFGTWTAATGTVADRFTFMPDGRYAGAAAAQHSRRISSTEVLRSTDAFFGDGRYAVQGNAMTLVADSDPSHPSQGHFRLEQESKDGGRTWIEKLCLLREEIGEVCYQRDR